MLFSQSLQKHYEYLLAVLTTSATIVFLALATSVVDNTLHFDSRILNTRLRSLNAFCFISSFKISTTQNIY